MNLEILTIRMSVGSLAAANCTAYRPGRCLQIRKSRMNSPVTEPLPAEPQRAERRRNVKIGRNFHRWLPRAELVAVAGMAVDAEKVRAPSLALARRGAA